VLPSGLKLNGFMRACYRGAVELEVGLGSLICRDGASAFSLGSLNRPNTFQG
jgi:hypothetical protein